MGDKTDPCKDLKVDLGDILHRCVVTIPIRLEDGRGALGMSLVPVETGTTMSSQVHCCLFVEREDGKYESVARLALYYEGAQQIKAFIEKLPEQIFSP